MPLSRFAAVAACAHVATAIDNGLGVTPPRGWRSWNQFDTAISQGLIEAQYEALAGRSRSVDGVPTSLLDLGYKTAGIDDGWQACNTGPGGVGFHNSSGYPMVDTTKFPDMRAMTAKARSLGITPGWYGNNCACKDTRPSCQYNASLDCFAGDVAATIDYGFGSIKLDGCGIEKDISVFASLFNASGTPVMLENCHNGNPTYATRAVDGTVDCPMNLFRVSADIRPQFGSILSNLMQTVDYNANLTGPGCWAYPDMLEVGVSQMPARGSLNFLTLTEARTHFAAWCIVSSPLVLSHDLTNDTVMDAVWPIISNREALAVNDAWAGDAGQLVWASDKLIQFPNCHWGFNKFCDVPAAMVWKKQLSGGKLAVLLMNNDNTTADVSVAWDAAPIGSTVKCSAAGCDVRDIHAHKDLGSFADGFTAKALAPHDSVFITVTNTA